jgi:hypothetical protein
MLSLRFFRRIRLLPGVTLNVDKIGLSTSVGTRGAHVTFAARGRVCDTVGLHRAG